MDKLFETEEELEDYRSISIDVAADILWLLNDEGWTVREVAEHMGVSADVINAFRESNDYTS